MSGNVKYSRVLNRTIRRMAGFGMIELMVAMALGLFLMGAIIQVFVSSKQSFNAVAVTSRLQENGNIGLNIVTDDLRRSGYMGGNSDISSISQGATGSPTIVQTPMANTCLAAGTNWVAMVSQGLFGMDDTSAGYACIPTAAGPGKYLTSDVMTVRYLSPWIVAEPHAPAVTPTWGGTTTGIYLRSSWFEGKIFTGANQANAANAVADKPFATREIVAHAYYIGDTGRTCGGQAVPALYRISANASGVPAVEELIAGVEQFQARYAVFDAATNNIQYFDAKPASIALADWSDATESSATKKVVKVQVWLLARSECTENGFTDTNTYTMGNTVYTPNDNFHRQLFSTVVTLRNN